MYRAADSSGIFGCQFALLARKCLAAGTAANVRPCSECRDLQ